MAILTDVTVAEIDRRARVLYGTILTRPTITVSDGVSLTYGCDVDIGPTDPTGLITQYKIENTEESWIKRWLKDVFGIDDGPPDLVHNLPGQEEWKLGQDLIYGTVMRNVTISRANAELIYADVGAAVRLERTGTGEWQIMGFAIEQPGTYTVIPVNLDDMTIGPIADLSITTRLLTFGELGTFDDFGVLPFGASAIFMGNVLQRVV